MFFVFYADACSTTTFLSASPSTNSLRQPDPKMEKYIECAEINRALGQSTRSQRRREVEELVIVTDAPEFEVDTMSSARYDEIASECHDLIQKQEYRTAKRCVDRLVVPKDHPKHLVFLGLYNAPSLPNGFPQKLNSKGFKFGDAVINYNGSKGYLRDRSYSLSLHCCV